MVHLQPYSPTDSGEDPMRQKTLRQSGGPGTPREKGRGPVACGTGFRRLCLCRGTVSIDSRLCRNCQSGSLAPTPWGGSPLAGERIRRVERGAPFGRAGRRGTYPFDRGRRVNPSIDDLFECRNHPEGWRHDRLRSPNSWGQLERASTSTKETERDFQLRRHSGSNRHRTSSGDENFWASRR